MYLLEGKNNIILAGTHGTGGTREVINISVLFECR